MTHTLPDARRLIEAIKALAYDPSLPAIEALGRIRDELNAAEDRELNAHEDDLL